MVVEFAETSTSGIVDVVGAVTSLPYDETSASNLWDIVWRSSSDHRDADALPEADRRRDAVA